MVIGTHMNQHGTGAFPSYATIATSASLNRATVIRHVEIAVNAGWLKKGARLRRSSEDGKSERDTNLYEVAFPDVVAQDDHLVAQDDHPGRTKQPGVVAQRDPNTPSITPPLTPQSIFGDEADVSAERKPSPEEDAFEIAWRHYPKRAGGNSKADAQKQWNARLKSGVDPKDMLAGVQRYAKFCNATGKTGTEYVKQAATFFGRGMHFAEPYNLPRPAAVNNHTNFQEKTYVGTPDDEIDWLSPGDGQGCAKPDADDVLEARQSPVE